MKCKDPVELGWEAGQGMRGPQGLLAGMGWGKGPEGHLVEGEILNVPLDLSLRVHTSDGIQGYSCPSGEHPPAPSTAGTSS